MTALPPARSLWTSTTDAPDRTGAALPAEVDVAVLGAGIAGLTTAYLLAYIAEQQLVASAVGMQARGWSPYLATFAAFLTRAYDFLRISTVLYPCDANQTAHLLSTMSVRKGVSYLRPVATPPSSTNPTRPFPLAAAISCAPHPTTA